MINFTAGFALGFIGCLFMLYYIGTRKHQGHDKKTTGPSSKTHMSENVVSIVRKEI